MAIKYLVGNKNVFELLSRCLCIYKKRKLFKKTKKKYFLDNKDFQSHTQKMPFHPPNFFYMRRFPSHFFFTHTHTEASGTSAWMSMCLFYLFCCWFHSFYSKSITLTHNFSLTTLSFLYTISSLTIKINLTLYRLENRKNSHSFCLGVRAKKEVFFRWPGPLGMKIENSL